MSPSSPYSERLPDTIRIDPALAMAWLHGSGWQDGQDLALFAYGSLMWNPGFPFKRQQILHLGGYHRRFCVWSRRYRGTESQPGLVLGLDRGGSCHGIRFDIDARNVPAIIQYLWDREMAADDIYHPKMILAGPDHPPMLAFIVNHDSRNYAAFKDPDQIARIINQGTGSSGPNIDYLIQTVNALDALALHDHVLHDLLRRCRMMLADHDRTAHHSPGA